MQDLAGLVQDPLVAQAVRVVLVIALIALLVRFARAWIGRRVADKDVRYRAGKSVVFAGYATVAVFLL